MSYLKRLGMAGLGAALLIAACGKDDETTVHSTPTAGSGGSAGSSGAQHMAGAGAGGESEGGTGSDCVDCEHRGTCGPYSLTDLCKPNATEGTCPDSPEDLLSQLRCDADSKVVRYESECGGTVVTSQQGLGRATWTFDASGKLVGSWSAGDSPQACKDGGFALSESYGTLCAPKGTGETYCDSANCLEHDACDTFGANFGCPKDVRDYEWLCVLGAAVERTASSCSGTRIHASNGIQTVDYDFDAEGKLIGVHSVGDVGDCDSWGLQCKSVGQAEELCNTGGAGAGGASGLGGAGGNP